MHCIEQLTTVAFWSKINSEMIAVVMVVIHVSYFTKVYGVVCNYQFLINCTKHKLCQMPPSP